MSFIELQQVAQYDYQEALVMTYMHISKETFHVLAIANKAHRLLFVLDFVNPWHILAYNFQTVHILMIYAILFGKFRKKSLNRGILHLKRVCLLKVRYI